MSGFKVAITKYKEKENSVQKAVELANAFKNLPASAKVVIKPNVLFWSAAADFPKWGVLTTSRVIEEVVILLRDYGVNDITIIEGIMSLSGGSRKKQKETCLDAYEKLGYNKLKNRYNVLALDIFDRPFEKVDIGEGFELEYNADILNCDFIVDIPVLKTHAQTVVSLGIKNLKGVLNVDSRKKCHSADPDKDLNYMISLLTNKLPPVASVIDGIFTKERGPGFDGKARRSDIIIASPDLLSGDMAGARVLGHNPADIPYLVHAAKHVNRPYDMSDIDILGEKMVDVESFHEYKFLYNDDNTLLKQMENMGIKGLYYHKYDSTMCSYCSGINGIILSAISMGWKGKPWDEVEVLTGKVMKPTHGRNKTVLIGQCMYKAHKDNPDIKEMIPIKGCPPKAMDAYEALQKAGIDVPKALFENIELSPSYFMSRYKGKPEFDEGFFRVE